MTRERMQSAWLALRNTVSKLHRDDRGAEALEKLLIVAVVVLPLLGVLIFFRGEINDWVRGNWNEVVQEGGQELTTGDQAP